MSALLEISGLSARYGAARVLHDVSFSVPEGEVVVVLGANGAGKTTLLRSITGMVSVSGQVSYRGASIAGRRPDRIARLGIGHVPQGRGTFWDLTVRENLHVGLAAGRAGIRSGKRSDAQEDIDYVLSLFPRLGERLDQVASGLSGGEQQMLAISRALMRRPETLLLDEPSLGLAPKLTQELFAALQSVHAERGTTLIVVEQNARLALALADAAHVLEGGRIVYSGRADDGALDEDQIHKAYLG